MSVELHAFVGQRIPSRDEWQGAIDALALPVELDQELDVARSTGFVPCRLEGRESGFELSRERAATVARDYPSIRKEMGGSEWAITLRWGGHLHEAACALAAAAGLVAIAEARIYFPDDNEWYGLEELKSEFEASRSG